MPIIYCTVLHRAPLESLDPKVLLDSAVLSVSQVCVESVEVLVCPDQL